MAVKWVNRREPAAARAFSMDMVRRLPAAARTTEQRLRTALSGPGPSAPGAAPGVDTGALSRDIGSQTFGGQNPGFIVGPRSREQRAILTSLERGYVGRDAAGRIQDRRPRPVIRQTLDSVRSQLLRSITRG